MEAKSNTDNYLSMGEPQQYNEVVEVSSSSKVTKTVDLLPPCILILIVTILFSLIVCLVCRINNKIKG